MNKIEKYLSKTIQAAQNLSIEELERGVELIRTAWLLKKQIIVMGNGGSSLTALHYVNDWNKSIFMATGIKFNGRTLIDNMGLITSYSNDVSYEDVFIEQLKNILNPGDLVIAISGSGNSTNVIKAVKYANDNQAITLGLCGYDGGNLLKVAQHSIWVNEHDMQVSEDMHFLFGHIVMQVLCNYLD